MISDRTSRNSTSSLESVRSELSKVYSPPAIYDTAGERLGSFHNSRRSSLISGSGDDGYRDIANVEYALVKRLTQTEEPASVECNRKQEECAEATIGQCGDKEAHLAVDGLVSDDSELDKGFAWVIAFCSMLAVFAAWGWTTAFGVFLSYFMSSNYFPGATDYDFALIGSMAVGFGQLFSPMTVLSYRIFGPYCTSGFGIFIQVIALILASFATKIWQLYVTLGLMGGSQSRLYVYLGHSCSRHGLPRRRQRPWVFLSVGLALVGCSFRWLYKDSFSLLGIISGHYECVQLLILLWHWLPVAY